MSVVLVFLAALASASATVFCSLGIQWKRGVVVNSLIKRLAVRWQAFMALWCVHFDPSICPMISCESP